MKDFTLDEIIEHKAVLDKKYPKESTVIGGRRLEYYLLPQSWHSNLPNFVYRLSGSKKDAFLLGLSDSVPKKFQPYFILEEYIEFMEKDFGAKNRVVEAENEVLALVPENEKAEYVHLRRDFFRNILRASRSRPEFYMFCDEDIDEFKQNVKMLGDLCDTYSPKSGFTKKAENIAHYISDTLFILKRDPIFWASAALAIVPWAANTYTQMNYGHPLIPFAEETVHLCMGPLGAKVATEFARSANDGDELSNNQYLAYSALGGLAISGIWTLREIATSTIPALSHLTPAFDWARSAYHALEKVATATLFGAGANILSDISKKDDDHLMDST